MRRFGAAATLALLVLVPSGAGAAERPLLAVTHEWRAGAALVRLDAKSLRPLARPRVSLGRQSGAWSFSPDGKQVAIGSWKALGLRIVDARSLRVLRDVRTRNGAVRFAAWLTPRRVVGWEMNGSFAVDPVAGKMLRYESHEGAVIAAGASRDAIVLLLSPGPGTRACRVAVAGLDARVREATIERVRCTAFWTLSDGTTEEVLESRRPGLAVDGDRAIVFGGADEPAAEVDLRTLRVTYQTVARRPAARTKFPLVGPTRLAVPIGNGVVAVTGFDELAPERDARGLMHGVQAPAGLTLVDTRTWTTQRVDETTAALAVDGQRVFAFGAWSERGGAYRGDGVRAYSRHGELLYHVLAQEPVYAAHPIGGALIVPRGREALLLDPATGASIGMVRGPLPEFLASPRSPLRG